MDLVVIKPKEKLSHADQNFPKKVKEEFAAKHIRGDTCMAWFQNHIVINDSSIITIYYSVQTVENHPTTPHTWTRSKQVRELLYIQTIASLILPLLTL